MIKLIVGFPDSGKSALAERLAVEIAEGRLIYLATMIAYDDTGRARIEKHRMQREGKGFITIEKPFALNEIADEVDEQSTVLLECISNLVGNEMYENGQRFVHKSGKDVTGIDEDDFGRKITDDIRQISDRAQNLIIVTNQFDEKDCENCDDETRKYIACVNKVNELLKEVADETEIL